jgi:1,4-alpha-glucan branching enzyme
VPAGFEWRLQDEAEASILAHERISQDGERVLVISNFTPVPHERFRLGVPMEGKYELLLNTDDAKYDGSGFEVLSSVETQEVESESLPQSLELRLPPLSTVFYKLTK